MSYKAEFTKASVEILNRATIELNGLEKSISGWIEEPGQPVQELSPVLNRLAVAALECEKVITFYSDEASFPLPVNRAVCRVQRAIAECLNALALLRVIPALARGTVPKGSGASELS